MNWPWVSRRLYDEACAHARAQVDYRNSMVEEIVDVRKQRDSLQDKYDALVNRLMDRHIPQIPQFDDAPPLLDQKVVAAIGERAMPGTPTYEQIYRTAEMMAQAGGDASDIIQAVLTGDEAPV